VNHFFQLFKRRIGVRTQTIAEEAMQCLCAYSWPGNIRELRNIIERMLVLHGKDEQLLPEHLPEEFHTATRPMPVAAAAAGPDAARCRAQLRAGISSRRPCRKRTACRRRRAPLGTTRRILKYRMREMNLKDEDLAAREDLR